MTRYLLLRSFVAFTFIALAPLSALAQRDLTDIPLPDPELERQTFEVAEGFEVSLFAADPRIAKPIQMSFDSAGRLWIASSEVYPHIEPGQQANDKIIVLEDVNGDGRADRTTVFADGLLIPTGVEPGDGGAYVANSTELLHLADTNGDGRADRQRIILSGFGTEDTHHILHTFRFGPDGHLYFNQSIYIHSHIETPHGVRRLDGGGIWRLRPETLQLDVLMRGLVNGWGHHFDRWGQSFGTDGAGGEGIHHFVPGGVYFTAVGAERILRGMNPGSPKHCGAEITSGRHLPDDWQGNILTNDFRAHRVCRFVLSEEGSTYVAREQPELIRSTNVAFRPVDIKMGPDGAIYIADWYNPIIQHGEVDFRDPRRDHTRGRIWRVTYKGRPLVERPKLIGAPTAELLDRLKDPEDWTRHHAKRVLKERGRAILPELGQWVAALDPGDPDYEHHLLEALWTYQSLDVVEPELLARLLEARDHRARAAATRVASMWHKRLDKPVELLAPRAVDEHPLVRLEAVRALCAVDSRQAADVALRALDLPVDETLDFALWLTSRELKPHWLPAVAAGETVFDGRDDRLAFALEAVGTAEVVPHLVRLLAEERLPPERIASALALVGRLGEPEHLAVALEQALGDDTSTPTRIRLLNALAEAAQRRQAVPAGDLSRAVALLAVEDDSLFAAVSRAVGRWQLEEARPDLLAWAHDTEASLRRRRAAIDALASLGGPASVEALVDLCDSRHPAELRLRAAVALVPLDLEQAAKRAGELLAEAEITADPTPLYAAFVQRQGGTQPLAAALSGRTLTADTAKIGLRVARASSSDTAELIAALEQSANLQSGARMLTGEQMQALIDRVATEGDPVRGEDIFRREELACLKCHAIGGSGGLVGPDLSSIGASAQVDYLIESLLLPSKAVKENYHAVVVSTVDGRILTGIKLRQTDEQIVLRNAEDEEIAIPLDDVDEEQPAASLMPEGLVDPLTDDELVDLVRFLSELGKVGDFAVAPGLVVRRWEVLQATGEARHLLGRTRYATAAGEHPNLVWKAAYSKVSGELPRDALPRFSVRHGSSAVGFARCQLEVTTAGTIHLALGPCDGLSLWVDGAPVELADEVTLDLSPGVHTLCFAVALDERSTGPRCEIIENAETTGRARPVGGK